jgi:hypothetical protein
MNSRENQAVGRSRNSKRCEEAGGAQNDTSRRSRPRQEAVTDRHEAAQLQRRAKPWWHASAIPALQIKHIEDADPCVAAKWPGGHVEDIAAFDTELKANEWIVTRLGGLVEKNGWIVQISQFNSERWWSPN